jgi:DNA-directed RNA polymerase subunit RPC12/RpoP
LDFFWKISVLFKLLKDKYLDRFLINWKFFERRREATDRVWSGQYESVRKGELAIPVKYVYATCKRKYEIIQVDVHHKCEEGTGRMKVGVKDIRDL